MALTSALVLGVVEGSGWAYRIFGWPSLDESDLVRPPAASPPVAAPSAEPTAPPTLPMGRESSPGTGSWGKSANCGRAQVALK